MLDVSVVICAYSEERWDNLCAAIKSVQRQSTPPREIIVVVDHNESLLERVRAHTPGVVALGNWQTAGASGARNSGVAASSGKVITFLDDDATAEPDWLERLVAGFEDPDVLGVGGALEPVWLAGRPQWFPDEFNWVVGCTYTGLPKATAPVRNLIAASMSVRREVYESIGGFRNGFGNVKIDGSAKFAPLRLSGDEETEFCIRALRQWPQGKWLHEPRARARHAVPAHRSSSRYFLRRCYNEGLGKGLMTSYVGKRDGLASERTYVYRTLPRGVARELRQAALRGDLTSLERVGAIVLGLTAAGVGYVVASVYNRLVGRCEGLDEENARGVKTLPRGVANEDRAG